MRFSSILVFAALGLVYVAPHAGAAEPLPYYDIRLNADGTPASFSKDAKSVSITPTETAARARAIDALKSKVPSLHFDENEFFATPHYIGSTSQFLTSPVKAGGQIVPRAITRQFVADHADLFRIDPVEVDNARVERDFITDHNQVKHLIYQQQIGGIDLYGCEIRTNVTARGELINFSSTMLRRPAGDFVVSTVALSPSDAIRAAAANVGITMKTDIEAASAAQGVTRKQGWKNTPDFRPDEPITSELIYFPLTSDNIRAAWSVLIPEIGIGNTYEMMVDATNGQILRRWNRLHFATTEPITLRVYTTDDPAPGSPGLLTPSSTQFPAVPRSLVTINPADISDIDPNGWMDDTTNTSAGNAVHVHLDTGNTNPTNTGAIAGSSYRVFDFPLEPASAPYDITVAPSDANARNASITNLFYLCNMYHDRLYRMGFNEVAKNFQLNNFGRGGTANDRVQADCQDGSGTNNSNFNTSGSDGSTGRMQMYIFTGPNPDRDGSLDSDIVYHEHSHGLSIRLSNGTVSGTQSGGMGEGWGDFFAVSLNAQAGDDPHANYPMGPYATYQLSGMTTNYYFGIRRFPYSTDMTKNPTTFADIDPAQLSFPPGIPVSPIINSTAAQAGEVHNVGDVWCNTLLECRAALWDNEGFSANQKMMQLVVDGLKLQPANPNFLQARDGILQADLADYGGVDQCLLWKAFTKRGMGPLATSPSGSTSGGVLESFSLVSLTFPGGPPIVQPGTPTTFAVATAGTAASIVPTSGSAQFFFSINGGGFVAGAMVATGTNQYNATIPATTCQDVISYYFTTGTCAGSATIPSTAPTQAFQAVSGTPVVSVSYNFETTPPWTVSSTATDGQWDPAPGVPVNCNRGDPPADYDGSGKCWLTRNSTNPPANDCNTDVDGGSTTLTSQVFDLTGLAFPHVQYARWYSNSFGASPATQVFTVEVSSNGGSSWVNLETVGPTASSPHPEINGGWFLESYRIADFVPLTNQFRIRFTASDLGSGSVIEAGIDAFSVFGYQCATICPPATGDINGDTVLDGNDITAFVNALLGTPTQGQICAGDFNGNSQLDDGDADGLAAALVSAP